MQMRMRQIVGTSADWARCDIVLGEGEIGVEQTASGPMLKIGDGASKFSSLPYVTGGAGAGSGVVHIGTNPPTTFVDGSLWFDPITGELKVYDQSSKKWSIIVNTTLLTPWATVPEGIEYDKSGKSVAVGNMPGTPEKFNVNGNAKVTATVFANTFDGNQVTSNHADVKVYDGDVMRLTGNLSGTTATYTGAVHAQEIFVDGQTDTVGSTQVPALLGPTGHIIRGSNVVFGQIVRDSDGQSRLRFTSADGSNHDINMMGQMLTGLVDSSAHPDAYNMYGPNGGVIAESAASVRWVENKFGGITGMNFKGAKDVLDGGEAPPTSFKANDWYIVRQDSYDDKGVLVGLMSDAWWDLLTPYSKLARTDEEGRQMREVFAGDHLIWADNPNPANAGFAYVENSNHHNRFISRFGDKMAGTLTLLKRSTKENQRPIKYHGHGFNIGCFGAQFISDNVTYPEGDTLSLNCGGGAGASQIEFVVNDGNGTRYHQISMAGNGSLRLPVSGSNYAPPGGVMLQQKNVHMGAHVGSDGANGLTFLAKHDASMTRKPFRAKFAVRGEGTTGVQDPGVTIEPTGVIKGVSAGTELNSVVILSQLKNYLDLSKTGGTHTFHQSIDMGNFRILGLPLPTTNAQPVTLQYLKDNSPTIDNANHVFDMRDVAATKASGVIVPSRLTNVAPPSNDNDVVTLIYLNQRATATSSGSTDQGKLAKLSSDGRIDGSMIDADYLFVTPANTVDVRRGGSDSRIINVKDPVNAQDAMTKNYFDASGTATGGTNADVGKRVILDAKGKISSSMLPSGLTGALHIKGAVDPTRPPPAHSNGDVHFASKGGALNAGYGLGSISVNAGDMIIYADNKWHVVANEIDLAHFYTKTQIDAKFIDKTSANNLYASKTGVYTKTESDTIFATKTSVHSVPAGGTSGQILSKSSNADYAVQWINPPASGGGTGNFLPITGGSVTGNTDIGGNFVVWGNFTVSALAYKTKIDSKAVDITGITTLHSDTNILGTLTASSTSTFNENALFKKSVAVNGSLNLSGATSDLNVGGTSTFHNVLNMSNNKITHLATPTAGTDAATKAYVDALSASVDLTGVVRVKDAGTLGKIDPTKAPPIETTSPSSPLKNGYMYFASKAGTLDAGFGLGSITVKDGDILFYYDKKWRVIDALTKDNSGGNPERRYLELTGGALTGPVTATRIDSTTGGIYSAKSFTGTDLAGAGKRLVFATAAGQLIAPASSNIDMGGMHILNLGRPTAGHTAVTLDWFNTHPANTASDRKLKNNIKPLTEGIDVVEKINTYSYEYNDDSMPRGVKRGVIADEIATVLPDLVVEHEDYLGVDYQQLIPVLINAVKDLKAEIDNLKKDLANARSN